MNAGIQQSAVRARTSSRRVVRARQAAITTIETPPVRAENIDQDGTAEPGGTITIEWNEVLPTLTSVPEDVSTCHDRGGNDGIAYEISFDFPWGERVTESWCASQGRAEPRRIVRVRAPDQPGSYTVGVTIRQPGGTGANSVFTVDVGDGGNGDGGGMERTAVFGLAALGIVGAAIALR